jgi:hypothetical protein
MFSALPIYGVFRGSSNVFRKALKPLKITYAPHKNFIFSRRNTDLINQVSISSTELLDAASNSNTKQNLQLGHHNLVD